MKNQIQAFLTVFTVPRVSLWIDALLIIARGFFRLCYTLAVVGGVSYLIFWRNESGWLFLTIPPLMLLRKGI